jgi:UDP-2,4-diacetamido-2,4,6-trideoxy-beta-L-altropyranose hydrolase
MRCLTLADALRKRGVNPVFLSRNHAGHLHQVVKARGYQLLNLGETEPVLNQQSEMNYEQWLGVELEVDADDTRARLISLSVDWLIVDHYSLDARWEESLRPYCKRIMAIDDLANRDHSVDVLLDHNLGKTTADYDTKVPTSCTLMVGPRYALLRPEFAALRSKSLLRRSQGSLRKLLITMGGVDLEDATGRVLEALKSWRLSADLEVTVIMGLNAPWRDQIVERARHFPFPTEVLINVHHMETLMCNVDLAIGAAGTTSWERCCLGLPTLQLVLAENQRPIADALSQAGAALQLKDDSLVEGLHRVMNQLAYDSSLLVRMSAAAANVTDGHGAERVAQFIKEGDLDNIQ